MTPDQDARSVARRRLDTNIVVEAGAGTGKTTLLTDRVLSLLLAGGPNGEGLSITRIVVLTFTEKAAGEIKIRLADRLNDLVLFLEGRPLPEKRAAAAAFWVQEARRAFSATDEKIRHRAAQALRELDRAPLSTLHGFCKTLLQLFPVEAGVNPHFQVDRGEALGELFDREWKRWLEQELRPGGPSEALWRELLAPLPLSELARLARAMVEAGPAEVSVASRLERLASLRRDLARVPEGKPAPRGGKILESVARLSDRLAQVERYVRDPTVPPPPEEEWVEPLKKWPASWAGLPGESVYRQAQALAEGVSPLGEAMVARARQVLGGFVALCRGKFYAAGWRGFDDLLRGARDLLARHPEVRRNLKERFGAVLVDEFQDTDPLQGEILFFLAERADTEASDWRQVLLAPGKLFIVGDPKQSVYRFRGADIRAYEAFVSLVLAQGGCKCDLQTSFRTHALLVDPVNQIFSGLMRETSGLQPAYLPLSPRPEGGGGGAMELVVVGPDNEDGASLSAPLGREVEARWIARWIVQRCGPEGSGRPWRLGEVALLFRSTAVLTTYLEALKAAHIPYLVESDRAFYSTPEVLDFLNFLRVVLDPGDRVSLVGLLRSPLILLEDREILALAEAESLDDRRAVPTSLPAETRARLARFYDLIHRLRSASRGESLGDFAGRLLRETPLLPAAGAAYHGEQSVSNLLKMARLAAEAGEERGETLVGFTRRLTRSVHQGVEEGESPLGEDRADAVRLLTVHKAKGLEYKVVFVPNLSGSTPTVTRRPSSFRRDWSQGDCGHRLIGKKWADLGMAFLEMDEQRRAEHEAVRLFYVAATRAREQMILLGNEKAASGSFMNMLRGVATPEPGAWRLPGGLRLPVTRVGASLKPAPSWPGPPTGSPPLLTMALEEKWKERRTAAEAVWGRPVFKQPSASSPKEIGPTVSFPSDQREGPAEFFGAVGRLCHGVLEQVNFASPGDLASLIDRAAAPLRADRPSLDWEKIRQETAGLLTRFLDSPLAQFLGTTTPLAREAPFLYAEGDRVVRGVIDLLYKKGDQLWIADYKTDRLRPGEENVRAQRYRSQGQDYRRAVEKALGQPCRFEVIFLRTAQRVECVEPAPPTST